MLGLCRTWRQKKRGWDKRYEMQTHLMIQGTQSTNKQKQNNNQKYN